MDGNHSLCASFEYLPSQKSPCYSRQLPQSTAAGIMKKPAILIPAFSLLALTGLRSEVVERLMDSKLSLQNPAIGSVR